MTRHHVDAIVAKRLSCESRSDTASQKRLNCSVALPEQKYGR
jgi:hypothetical protein